MFPITHFIYFFLIKDDLNKNSSFIFFRDDVCVWVQKLSGISMGPGATADQDQNQTIHLMKQIIHSLRER